MASPAKATSSAVALLLLVATAQAQPRIIPKGAVVEIEDGRPDSKPDIIIVPETYALIPRAWLDVANARNATLVLTVEDLKKCEEARRLVEEDRDGWLTTGLKWVGVGFGLAGAFALGRTLR